jgi:hypothetical protein
VRIQTGFKNISNEFKIFQTLSDSKGAFRCPQKLEIKYGWKKARDEEQLCLKNFPQIRNGFGSKIQRTPMS